MLPLSEDIYLCGSVIRRFKPSANYSPSPGGRGRGQSRRGDSARRSATKAAAADEGEASDPKPAPVHGELQPPGMDAHRVLNLIPVSLASWGLRLQKRRKCLPDLANGVMLKCQ